MRLSKFSFFVFLNFFQKIFKFFFCRQTVPPSSFLIFCSKLKFQKAQRVPLSSFRHCETVSKFSFFVFSKVFSKNFQIFLLSPNGPPFKFFDILQQTEVSKSPKGPPFLVFRHCETFKILIFRFFEFFSKNFQIFLLSPNGPPFKFFDILQQTEVSKSPKGPPL